MTAILYNVMSFGITLTIITSQHVPSMRENRASLCTQNTPIHIVVSISFTVQDFQNL